MSTALCIRRITLILGLAVTVIATGQASTPIPLANPLREHPAAAAALPTVTAPFGVDTFGQPNLASATVPGTAPGIAPPSLESSVGVSSGTSPLTELSAADRANIHASIGKLPLSFIENQGQADERIAYYIQSPGRSLYFTPDGHVLRLTQGKGADAKAHTIKVELVDAAPECIDGLARAPGIVSYFKGPKENWKTAIPTHGKIGYVQPWPGIDLSYDGTNGILESIYTVAPHADPGQIKLRYSGQDGLRLDDEGNLVYTTSLGEIKETAPTLYQEIDGARLPVEGRYVLLDDTTVAFQVAEYNPDHVLIIDPTLIYAGFIGGDGDDIGTGIAVDSAGNAYVTGYTDSTAVTPPFVGGPDLTYNGGTYDAFVAKVNAAGTALVYAGFIGGSGDDIGAGIAVDSAGNAYVTGYTDSDQTSFPVLGGPDVTHNGGTYDAFVAKVNAAGTALAYAGYIGGSGDDIGAGIAVDSAGNAYVTGYTDSDQTSFPVLGGPNLTYGDGYDVFVAKVNAAGTALVYAGYIGGSGEDIGTGIAVDSAGNAYVTGYTDSDQTSFPVIGGPDVTYNGGAHDAFVAKVNPSGTALIYAGFIGGSGDDIGAGIAVDSAGNAYVTGYTDSTATTFPVGDGPDLTQNGGFSDAFVAKVNAAGAGLAYAGFIGGFGDDAGAGIAVDSAGIAYVTGNTRSTGATFPVVVGPNLTSNGFSDAFVAKISATVFDLAANGNSGAEVTLGNPVTLSYLVAGCQNREMYLVLNAPAMGIAWSFLTSVGSWQPLPANLADITPFNALGPADGGYILYSDNAPLGDYELYLGCDFVTNNHLDYTGGTTVNGIFDHIIVRVR